MDSERAEFLNNLDLRTFHGKFCKTGKDSGSCEKEECVLLKAAHSLMAVAGFRERESLIGILCAECRDGKTLLMEGGRYCHHGYGDLCGAYEIHEFYRKPAYKLTYWTPGEAAGSKSQTRKQ